MEVPPDQGRKFALRWLARRPLTESEIRGRLADKGFDEPQVERTVGELIAKRLIEDSALARDYIVLRSQRLRLGKERLLRDLQRRGVDPEIADRAYREAVEVGDLDPEALLREALTRRIGRERERSTSARRRVYNALLRAGFPAAGLYAELKRQRDAFELAEHEYDDESP